MSRAKILIQFCWLGIILFITGCTPEIQNVTVDFDLNKTTQLEKKLIQRYKTYWYYFSNNDWDKTYDFELPYQRFFFPIERYKHHFTTAKKDFNIKLISINRKNINISYLKSEFIKDKLKYQFDDKWVNVNGTWYHKFHSNTFELSEY
jgi:hypothetical protein